MRLPTRGPLLALATASLAGALVTGPRSPSGSDETLSARSPGVVVNPDLLFTPAPSSPPRATRLTKRLDFTFGSTAVQDYCGETSPTETFGASAPLATDCAALASAMEVVQGFYTLTPSDFATASGWVTVLSHGTCAFKIAFQDAAAATTARLGTNDIRFYIESYLGDAQGGRIQAVGGIACFNQKKMITLNWGMLHAGT